MLVIHSAEKRDEELKKKTIKRRSKMMSMQNKVYEKLFSRKIKDRDGM